MAELPPLHRTQANGIPLLWSPCPGPLAGGIVFRVGRADEPVPQGGITHLVEHLAMSGAEDGPYDECNAFIDAAVTVFAARGEPADVAGFVNRVAATLSDLPLGRVAAERRVLNVEGAEAGVGVGGELLVARYGLRGFGVVGGRELGLGWLGPEQVAAYAARYFTAGNAALWFTGPPPPSLDPVLPAGPRQPLPLTAPRPTRLPACIQDEGDEHDQEAGVALGLLVPWGAAAAAGLDILERRAFKRLRADLGASYHVEAGPSEDLDADTVHALVVADALHDGVPKVRDALLAVVDGLAEDGPTRQELDRSARDYQRSHTGQPELDGWVCYQAANELYGRPFQQPAERAARLSALPAGEVATVFQQTRGTAIMALPSHCPPPDGFALLEPDGGEPVTGRTHRFALPFSRRRLVAAEEGLTLTEKHGRVTVRFDDCVAVLTWSDGAHVLLGDHGASILFSPEAFRDGADVAALIQRRVPHDRWVPMDELEPSPLAR
jgi:zinc protease